MFLPDHRPAVAGATTWLRQHGLGPGDRLATQLPSTPDTFALGLACLLSGVVQVPLPADLRGDDRDQVLADADPRLVLMDPAVAAGVPAPPGKAVVSPPAGGWTALPATDPPAPWPRTRPMAYTSGTTGRRKGVHVGIHEPGWGQVVVTDEHDAFDRRHGDRHLVVSPLYHSGPFRFATVTALMGGRVAVMEQFDVPTWQRLLRELRPTSVFCVPTHLHRLLAHPDTDTDLFASLTLLVHAGAPCPVPLKERVLELAPEGSVWEFYGSTEGQFTVCPPDAWRRSPGSVGRARPGRTLEIRDPDEHGIGTVWVTVPDHARWRYWRAPERTAAAWDQDAFTVGDLGRLDGGVLTLHGRPGDLVITGGVNVYPAEVERVLLALPDVAEAVAFGVPDDEWGERLVAAVVPHLGATVDPEEVLAACRQRLRRAQVPRTVRVVDDLPRTPTGKVRRVGLAAAIDPAANGRVRGDSASTTRPDGAADIGQP